VDLIVSRLLGLYNCVHSLGFLDDTRDLILLYRFLPHTTGSAKQKTSCSQCFVSYPRNMHLGLFHPNGFLAVTLETGDRPNFDS